MEENNEKKYIKCFKIGLTTMILCSNIIGCNYTKSIETDNETMSTVNLETTTKETIEKKETSGKKENSDATTEKDIPITEVCYDSNGNKIRLVAYDYDEKWNLIKSTTKNMDGQIMQIMEYDKNGYEKHLKEYSNGEVKTEYWWEYNEQGIMLSQTLQEGQVEIYTKYNEQGDILEYMNADAHEHISTELDEYGNIVRWKYENSETRELLYELIAEYEYYPNNVVKSMKCYRNGVLEVLMEYDENANIMTRSIKGGEDDGVFDAEDENDYKRMLIKTYTYDKNGNISEINGKWDSGKQSSKIYYNYENGITHEVILDKSSNMIKEKWYDKNEDNVIQIDYYDGEIIDYIEKKYIYEGEHIEKYVEYESDDDEKYLSKERIYQTVTVVIN